MHRVAAMQLCRKALAYCGRVTLLSAGLPAWLLLCCCSYSIEFSAVLGFTRRMRSTFDNRRILGTAQPPLALLKLAPACGLTGPQDA
jgi:hypothetical protein